MRLGLAVASVIVIADQIIKWWAIALLAEQPYGIEVLPFFNPILVWNQGISFVIFGGGLLPPWLLGDRALAVALPPVLRLPESPPLLRPAPTVVVSGRRSAAAAIRRFVVVTGIDRKGIAHLEQGHHTIDDPLHQGVLALSGALA